MYSIKNILFGDNKLNQNQPKEKTLKVDLFLRRLNKELPYNDTNLEFRCIFCINELKDWFLKSYNVWYVQPRI